MKSTIEVSNMLSFTVWLIMFNSYIQLSNSVSIITASNKPSRVHWSSPTYSQTTHSQRDRIKLPSSIIVSTSLGLRNRPKPGEANTDNGNKRFQIISPVEQNRNKGAAEIGVKDKIKFYSLECTKGSTCSSIIPARPSKPPPMRASRFSKDQLQRYFRLFNPHNKDSESRSSSPPINSVNKNEGAGSNRKQRHFESYWPGSDQRPQSHQYMQLINDFKNSFPSKGKVVKYETISSDPRISPELNFPTRRPAKRPIDTTARPWWEEIDSVYPDSENESDKVLYPNHPPSPISRPVSIQPPTTSHHSTGKKGSWRRYGTSTVSQLNKNTGEWEKVSTSNTQLNGSSPSARPSGTKDDVYKASAALTVLGVSDREPHSAFIDSVAHKPHTILVPSADPDKPPHKIETDNRPAAVAQSGVTFTVFRPKPSTPSNVSSHVSVPLFIIPTNISIQKNETNSPAPGTPLRQVLPTTTTTTTTTTKRPTTRPTTTTTTTTQAPAFLDNPYAVMAAVGAGLIPATFAALLPVFVGGKRRRRRRSDSQIPLDQKLENNKETDILTYRVLQTLER